MGLFSRISTTIKRGTWGDLKWTYVRKIYGEEIAGQLYAIPGALPTSLMNAKEAAALDLLIALYNKQQFDLKNSTKVSQEESRREVELAEEAFEILDMHGKPNVKKWQARLNGLGH